jgi:gliding motility-associated-like protein
MIRLLVIILFFLGISHSLLAQHASENGLFSVDYVMGCEGMVVTLNYPACNGSDPSQTCGIRFGDGRDDEVIQHLDQIVYPTAGTYTMIVGNSTIEFDAITIHVMPSPTPMVDASSCTAGMVQVDIKNTAYPNYIIDYGNGDSFTIASTSPTHQYTFAGLPPSPPITSIQRQVEIRGNYGPGSFDNCPVAQVDVDVYNELPTGVISLLQLPQENQIDLTVNTNHSVQYRLMTAINSNSGLQYNRTLFNETTPTQTLNAVQPDNFYYCFRLDTYNPCTNSSIPTEVICSQKFEVTAVNNENILRWQTGNESTTHTPSSFVINKDGSTLTTLPITEFEFRDNDIICNVNTTYSITTTYPNGAQSISLAKEVTSISTSIPTRIEDISAIVEDHAVTLHWEQDPAYTVNGGYIITKRKEDATSFLTTGTALTTTFTDATYEAGACYRIQYKDDCENVSQWSVVSCPIALSGKVQPDNSILLDWTPYAGWDAGIDHYEIEKYNSRGDLLETISVGLNTTYHDTQQDEHQEYAYVVVATPSNSSLTVSASNQLPLIKKIMLHHPNAFTPNGDGLNDKFSINGLYIEKFDLKIFNRWGELVFQTNDPTEGWDGKSHGNQLPQSTYVFRVVIQDQAGRVYDESGSFLLLNRN